MNKQQNPVKVALLILVLSVAGPMLTANQVAAQAPAQAPTDLECGTVLSPETRDILLQRAIDKNAWPPLAALDAPYCMPIAIHVVRDDDGNGGISQARLDQGLMDINNHELYVNTNMSFYYLPDIDYISDDEYFSIDNDAEADAVRGINRVANAINVYFVPEFPGACGRASFSPDAVQGLVMNNSCTGGSSNPSTYPHELGHYFDLLHTHDSGNGAELVDGSNCASAGDLLCDTPADPRLTDLVDSSCIYFGTATDANDDSYNPDTSQLMSYAPKLCRVNVTPEGEARALNSMLTARAYLLNCPPIADCGGPYVVECTSCTTTMVQLDGTGSIDPEGEDLTFLWSGVAFDDPTSATPTGPFPLGTTEVTLVVSDGMGETECTVNVEVVDTTPPVLACPANIIVECSTLGGTPKSELAAFLADYTVSDICDCDPQVVDDAPFLFSGPCEAGGGVTTVTWTATDASGNSSSCTADVTVVDTTPPVFDTLTLDRDVLWPPNHKMSEILVTIEVSDVCDSDPVVTLDSITSNEPDNGMGDGDTENDIQEAVFGSDDRGFFLRSERSGTGDGRIYTIVYTVTDCSGNGTTDHVTVSVPHNQGMNAVVYSGVSADGTTLLTSVKEIKIVIPSVPVKRDLFSGSISRSQADPIFDARWILQDRILLGNASSTVAPVKMEIQDMTGDGALDLLLTFDAWAVQSISQTTSEFGPVGVQFRTAVKSGYRLVEDVFLLGAPMTELDIPLFSDKGSDNPSIDRSLAISPNPFNPQTSLSFGLDREQHVRMRIYNLRGQMVREIVDETLAVGHHQYVWSGRDNSGGRVASGFYMVRLERGDRIELKKMMMLK